jgi:hypothetical protein
MLVAERDENVVEKRASRAADYKSARKQLSSARGVCATCGTGVGTTGGATALLCARR